MKLLDLFKPAWQQDEDWEKALKAVSKIKNQRKLAKIVKKIPYWDARKEAVEKMDNRHQTLFADIAKNDTFSGVREIAVEKMDNRHQTLFADIAKNDTYDYVRKIAVEKLNNRHQTLFADIAKNDEDILVRFTAIKKLDKNYQTLIQDVLIDLLLKKSSNHLLPIHMRIEAIDMLDNPHSIIQDVYLQDIQKQHIGKITNQVLLAVIAKKHVSSNYEAVKNLTDQALLANVAKNAEDIDVRLKAIEELNNYHQELFANIAKNDEIYILPGLSGHSYYYKEGRTALEKLTDQALLADVAKNAKALEIRVEAAQKLTNNVIAQEVYADVAKNGKGANLSRLRAIRELTDKNVLAGIAKNDEDNDVRETAAEQLTNINK